MPSFVPTDADLAATLALHLDGLATAPAPRNYLAPPVPPPLVLRALGRLGHEAPLHEWLLRRTVALRSEARSRLKRPPGAGPRFLIRVDDFPRWDHPLEEFLAFHRAMGGAPYLLGVTPRLARDPFDVMGKEARALSDEERRALDRFVKEGVEIALHGLSHRTRAARPHSELAGLSADDAARLLDDGLSALGRPAIGFIPPFNHFEPAHWPALAKRFAVVAAGGRESAGSFGFFTSPAILGGAVYAPSYAPAYGRAKDIRRFATELLRTTSEEVWVPLTLHWAWEQEDAFRAVSALVGALRGRLYRWQDLVEDARRVA